MRTLEVTSKVFMDWHLTGCRNEEFITFLRVRNNVEL
jgi:hypothetical protein